MVWVSVRMNGIVRESAKAEESATPPEPSKGPFGDEVCARRTGSLGQVDGAQGVLIQPGWIRGCGHTKFRRCATSANRK